MNRNESNQGNDKRTDKSSVTGIRSDAKSNDMSSGKSASGREPQKGGAIDDRDSQRDTSRTDGSSKR